MIDCDFADGHVKAIRYDQLITNMCYWPRTSPAARQLQLTCFRKQALSRPPIPRWAGFFDSGSNPEGGQQKHPALKYRAGALWADWQIAPPGHSFTCPGGTIL